MKKLAFVLAGGGAAGIRHAGYLEVLESHGLIADCLYGASAGALSAAAYSWRGISGLQDLWFSIRSIDDVFSSYFWVQLPWKRGLKASDPLLRLVTKAHSTPKTPFKITSVDLVSKKMRFFDQSHPDIVNMVVASASIPGIVSPYSKEDKDGVYEAWVDGGVRENLPLKEPILDGADVIVALHCYPLVEEPPTHLSFDNPLDTIKRTIDVLCDERQVEDSIVCVAPGWGRVPIIHVAPKKATISTMDFDPKLMRMAFQEARSDMEEKISEIKEKL